MRKTKKHIHYRRRKTEPLKKRTFDNSKFKDLFICLDETVWDEDMNTGNNSWE